MATAEGVKTLAEVIGATGRASLVPPTLEFTTHSTIGQRRHRQVAEIVFDQFDVGEVRAPARRQSSELRRGLVLRNADQKRFGSSLPP
jgi:hypothetical protein